MDRIAIVTDSGCDLPAHLVADHNIHVVPLVVRFGAQQYLDGQLSLDEFWVKARQAPPFPETSQPSAGMFEEAFRPLVEQGYHVLCLAITSKHSGTFNSAYAGAQSFPGRVTVFDTLSLSLGQGYQALTAARMAAQGDDLAEIVKRLEHLRSHTHLFIALDTIEYLRRGGRADQLIPILERVARVLNIKPMLHLDDGQLKLLGAARSREKAMQHIVDDVAKHAPAEALIVAHTRLQDDAAAFAQRLAERLRFPADQVMIAEAGPALSSHAGPGVMAGAIVQRLN